MGLRQPLALVVALGLAGGIGCSKTQDTAPENRIFGTPPIIQSVDVVSGQGSATCDITQAVVGHLCEFGLLPSEYTFVPGPAIVINVVDSETTVTARIVDPEDTPTKSDILLATTSYQTPPTGSNVPPEEISLVMLDDGQTTLFPYDQQVKANCTIDPSPGGVCECLPGQYQLTTGDAAAGDHVFTRSFIFVQSGPGVPANASPLLADCVAQKNRQFPTIGTKFTGKSVPLKIEAVDHEGNLTTWPVEPPAAIVPSLFECTGDKCACCLMTSSDPISECRGPNFPGVTISSSSFCPPGDFCTVCIPFLFP